MNNSEDADCNSKDDNGNLDCVVCCGDHKSSKDDARADKTTEGSSYHEYMLEDKDEEKCCDSCEYTTDDVSCHISLKELKCVEEVSDNSPNIGVAEEVTANTAENHKHKVI